MKEESWEGGEAKSLAVSQSRVLVEDFSSCSSTGDKKLARFPCRNVLVRDLRTSYRCRKGGGGFISCLLAWRF